MVDDLPMEMTGHPLRLPSAPTHSHSKGRGLEASGQRAAWREDTGRGSGGWRREGGGWQTKALGCPPLQLALCARDPPCAALPQWTPALSPSPGCFLPHTFEDTLPSSALRWGYHSPLPPTAHALPACSL